MGVNTTRELSEKLGKFNYKDERILPAELMQAIGGGDIIVHKGKLLRLEEVIFAHPTLVQHLVDLKIPTDGTPIPTLYVGGSHEQRVYYHHVSRERLGDELGIYKWFQKG